MKQVLTIASCTMALIMTTSTVFGQRQFELPQDITLNTKEDYVKYETTLVDAAQWLEQTDLDKETAKRQQVNAFVIRWITGSPTVTIALGENLGKIYGKNEQLLVIYTANYAKNVIETKNNSSTLAPTKAGLISIMNVYKKGIDISKSKEMDKIIKLSDSELENYITDKLK